MNSYPNLIHLKTSLHLIVRMLQHKQITINNNNRRKNVLLFFIIEITSYCIIVAHESGVIVTWAFIKHYYYFLFVAFTFIPFCFGFFFSLSVLMWIRSFWPKFQPDNVE